MRPTKIQIKLPFRTVCLQYEPRTFSIEKEPSCLHADRYRLDCADAQADLSLRWIHKSEDIFCSFVAVLPFYVPLWAVLDILIPSRHTTFEQRRFNVLTLIQR